MLCTYAPRGRSVRPGPGAQQVGVGARRFLPSPPCGQHLAKLSTASLLGRECKPAAATVNSTPRLLLVWWVSGTGLLPVGGRAPQHTQSVWGSTALRGRPKGAALPRREGRSPETERGQHRLVNVSRCLEQGSCSQRRVTETRRVQLPGFFSKPPSRQ